MITIKQIPYETARRAYMGTSISPKKRAEIIIESYNTYCDESIQEIKEADLYTEKNKEIIQSCFDYYHKLYIDWLSKESRCLSPMITGPAKFPVRSNQKKLNYAHNALELVCNYSIIDDVRKRINRKKKKEMIQELVESGEFETKTIFEKPGVKIVNNKAMERVQIFFDEKPDIHIRKKLKQYAFRWAPSIGAWQRKNTVNGIWAAKNVIKDT